MMEIVSLIIPCITSIALVLAWIKFFLETNQGMNIKKAGNIYHLAWFSVFFFMGSMIIEIAYSAKIAGIIFILGWILFCCSTIIFYGGKYDFW
jgi:hypothetical protein